MNWLAAYALLLVEQQSISYQSSFYIVLILMPHNIDPLILLV
jgi:hypothetical protein